MNKPPSNFDPCGELAWAVLCERIPGFTRNTQRSGRKLNGIRYEKKVHEHFAQQYGEFYQPGIWFMFRERGSSKVRYAQADALLFDFDLGHITIVEVKYQHIEKSWWQLRHLYAPLVKHLFGDMWQVRGIEVVKWYDPAARYPGPVKMCKTLDQAPCLATTKETGVHIWRP